MDVENASNRVASAEQNAFIDSVVPVRGSDVIQNSEIGLQLERILASPPFRNSKRNTQFLRFVVERTVSGHTSEIKERLIGVEVFGRPLHYDLSADPIVRVAAAELRKRLAQYYAEPDHSGELRLELPLGTYVPLFHRANLPPKVTRGLAVAISEDESAAGNTITPAADPNPSVHAGAALGWTRRTRAITVVTCALVLLAIAAVFSAQYFTGHSAQRSLNAFWAPLMNEGVSITVCVGDLNYIFQAPPYNTLDTHTTTDNLLNSNAGAALLRVGEILGSKGRQSTLRLADHTELSDLRQQPAILIGGMNNPWTQRILEPLRFRLTSKPGGINGNFLLLTDTKNAASTIWRVDLYAPPNSITRDYSLVTRMNDPLTGQPVVILCGLGPYGTAAASEFVSNPNYFFEFSKQAPKGWENRNIQIVLETTVVDRRVSVPRVVAEQVY
jgi:hypothetical protein